MARNRKTILKSLILGLICSIVFTLLCMLILAAALILLRFPDNLLTTLNQIVKLAAVVIGTCASVPRGGEKGLVTGTVLGLFYSVLGYVLFILLGEGSFSIRCLLGEIMLAWAAGAVTGAIRANLPSRSRSKIKHAS